MKKVYFIERRTYAVDKDTLRGVQRTFLGDRGYSSFKLAHKAFEQIKGLQLCRHQYVPELDDYWSCFGIVKWPELNILEEYEIVWFKVEEASDE